MIKSIIVMIYNTWMRTDRAGSDKDKKAGLQNIAAESCLLCSGIALSSSMIYAGLSSSL